MRVFDWDNYILNIGVGFVLLVLNTGQCEGLKWKIGQRGTDLHAFSYISLKIIKTLTC